MNVEVCIQHVVMPSGEKKRAIRDRIAKNPALGAK